MKRLKIILILFAALAFSCGLQKENILVKEAFENYKAAILNDKGEDAVKYVDSRTIKYYGEMLEYVKTADS